MRVTFYYVRHGQTLFNKIRRLQGSCDSPLTEQGIQEAEKAAEALRLVPFTRAYCSSSERAVDTAAIILKERSLKAEPMKGLKEFDFGLMDGALIEQVKPEMTERRKKDSWKDIGGDDTESITNRIIRTFSGILSECKDGDRVLIVSHGSYCLHMLKPLFGIDPVKFREERSENGAFPVPNGGIMKFEWADGSWKMLELPTEPEKFHD